MQTLEILEEAAVTMSSGSYPTLSQYMPIVQILKKVTSKNTVVMKIDFMEDLCESKDDLDDDLAILLSNVFHKRYSFIDTCHDAIAFAMILNPRFRCSFNLNTKQPSYISLYIIKRIL